ncbi:MAG: sigma-54-dependent Fis family transcriptional regulator [Rhodocyclaceae bacterium]|nr:sigma-54-dependent Fis family transcriptional regulator [Rhodocyclaceae bacterium]
MTEPTKSARQRDALARKAREAFFESIQGDPASDAALAEHILASWRRSRAARVPTGFVPGDGHPADRGMPVSEMRERNGHLLGHARGAMGDLAGHIGGSGSIVILADASANVLEIQGDPGFARAADYAGLRIGATWREDLRGTNAIGVALQQAAPVEIVGSEHYLDNCAFLTCAAAPIRDAQARVMGVLAIAGHVLPHQEHTVSLVRMGTRLIERRLFEVECADAWLVGLSDRSENLGTLHEGLLAFAADGRLEAADATAARHLSIPLAHRGDLDFGMLFDEPFDRLYRPAAVESRSPLHLARRDGSRWPARVVPPRGAPELAASMEDEAASPVLLRRRAPEAPAPVVTLARFTDADPRLKSAAERAARVVGKPIPLLILGESGVGKERFARACHLSGPRHGMPFVPVNCAAIPETLIESELFGYAPGAFTGARREGFKGRIEQAHGGTLFLDEIGDMPLALQTRLLRVLQERQIEPLGALRPVPVDLSVVCATHCDLQVAVKAGRFRADLYFRIAGLIVTLPSLRERADLSALIREVIDEESGLPGEVAVSSQAHAALLRHAWPGNIRELVNTVRVALALLDPHERRIDLHHLHESFAPQPDGSPEAAEPLPVGDPAPLPAADPAGTGADPVSLRRLERQTIEQCLEECGGNVSRAARRLGISRNTLYRKLGRLG